ncbi:MAG: hypothetical protein OEZ01_16590, partial [Candidatus Heimdallarchaeota archaeon]|nr:hypothetical protein [Candidatus Heimdallarchaeota archaeon]
MSKLISISDVGCVENRWLDLIFIHGLNGDYNKTWHNNSTNFFWPKRISEIFPDIRVLTYSYDIGITKASTSNTLTIIERAQNTLDLFSVENIGEVPVGFICHSYGGLLAKDVLKLSYESDRHEYKRISENTLAMFFLATPHQGSVLATWLNKIGFLLPT